MIPEPIKPLLRFLINLPHHDLCQLFSMVELAINELEFESLDEELLCDHFKTYFWIATKRDQL